MESSTKNDELRGSAQGSDKFESQGSPSYDRSSNRRVWTAEEDQRLTEAIGRWGSARGPGNNWGKVSEFVGGGRTNKDCRKRWLHSLDPSLRKGRWSAEEDHLLRELYDELGPQWKAIALRIPGRKDDQCSKRWKDALSPGLTPTQPWSPLEDALLLQLLQENGPKWTILADHLPGRSSIACRNRSRKYQLKATPASQTAPDTTAGPSQPVRSSAGPPAMQGEVESAAPFKDTLEESLSPLTALFGHETTSPESSLSRAINDDLSQWMSTDHFLQGMRVSSNNLTVPTGRAENGQDLTEQMVTGSIGSTHEASGVSWGAGMSSEKPMSFGDGGPGDSPDDDIAAFIASIAPDARSDMFNPSLATSSLHPIFDPFAGLPDMMVDQSSTAETEMNHVQHGQLNERARPRNAMRSGGTSECGLITNPWQLFVALESGEASLQPQSVGDVGIFDSNR